MKIPGSTNNDYCEDARLGMERVQAYAEMLEAVRLSPGNPEELIRQKIADVQMLMRASGCFASIVVIDRIALDIICPPDHCRTIRPVD